ncbi:tRNA nucleotidyltransferase [Legionella adelaidensis]|uniref:Multifunctional CCA protein n=1 Tax=Legionella adelaidensis TaxID=45056 RepID=A0A0W0R5X9_9GAMM|nr:multifunctional CCA addition/repair protein [Legionella adelaidensis]KTC66495.1 tRNA nucleotidyltransferase [Legionella adelaidensis]
MKIYLVGGAVRDKLLGYSIKERDWVVVGANPNLMLQKGFQRVGKDFPVFLHPKTHEEYALARTERKKGVGYYGFSCDYNEQVTLEEDLARRDLTINAIAQDEDGKIIDPFQGSLDIEKKILRHVSPAFVEDPVRVLRIARFAARFHHLGFKVAEETQALMYSMVKHGELQHLVAERVWQEWFRSLQEKNPEVFVQTLRSCGALEIVIPEMNKLFGVPNLRKYHAEVDSGIHTLMVVQSAVSLSEDPLIRFTAMVHDLGKAVTPMRIWPSQYGHEERGVNIINKLCQRLRIPTEYRKFAELVCKHHINIHRIRQLRPDTIVRILEQTDAFRRSYVFEKMLIVCEADDKGKGFVESSYPQKEQWLHLLQECSKITAQGFIEQGYEGAAIKKKLHEARVQCVAECIKKYKMEQNEE